MIAILLIISCTLVSSHAQYSNVRYQPENTQDSYADKKYYDQQQDLSNYYRLPEVDAPQTFGIPADSYEVPSYIYTGTFNPEAQQKNNDDTPEGNKKDRKDDIANNIEIEKVEGAYYVLLPSSQLQRVQFMTENDRQNMAYTARLSYRSESAPIFVYMPQQYQPTAA
ncbi:uncharacterized protein LOC121733987 [Aricia agestis]|uniref:uncharacterized protein LOC121733987 n=1 Tax=Aricia agestis TaxID=91739 RepID=UPI001C2064F0|nr:uncharacterized protein LOC121733987 [Aricia agestis]